MQKDNTQSRKKVLCLSFWSPPVVRPQAILIGKMLPEWKKQGIEPILVTYEGCGDLGMSLEVYRIAKFKLNNFFKRLYFIKVYLKKKYYEKIYEKIRQIILENDIKIVFSFSNPQESNIIGAMIKKRLGIPFVSHFSDPWVDNPYSSYSFFKHKKIIAWEKFIIENSDKIIFTNKRACELIMEKYSESDRQKTVVIPHCFNPNDYPDVEKEKFNEFIFSYIGAFYKQRTPELFFKALQKVFSVKPELTKKTKIKLVGAVAVYTGYDKKSIENMIGLYNLGGVVEIVPSVSYEESLRQMKFSNCLIAIDADILDSPFLPSKVIDYAGSGSLVLGITPDNSPTAQVLHNLGYKSFNYSQVEEMADYISQLLTGNDNTVIDKEYLKNYHVKNTTDKLLHQFSKILTNK